MTLCRTISMELDVKDLDLVRIQKEIFNISFQLDGEFAADSPDVESVETAVKTEPSEPRTDAVQVQERNLSYVGTIPKKPSWVQKREKGVSQDSISIQSSVQSSKRNSLESETEESEGLKRLWRRMTRRRSS